MNQLGKNLLSEVKASIASRISDSETYATSFVNANSFITATINGQLEFVPLDLLAAKKNKLLVQLEVATVFGKPEQRSDLDDRLIKFYADHDLQRDIHSANATVGYYLKPVPVQEVEKDPDFFDEEAIKKLAPYAGKKYLANDPFLKNLGALYSESVMQPTNKWGELVAPKGYTIEPERYWQVAGRFKTFTWSKLTKEKYQDRHVFFSVGVDVEQEEFVIKLDCLRSGTNKLSNLDIRKFDYFTAGYNCVNRLSLDYFPLLNWETLSQIAKEVVKELEPVYEGVVQYLFGDAVDIHKQHNKILLMTEAYSSDNAGTIMEDGLAKVYDLTLKYEQFNLEHTGKSDLTPFVKISLMDELFHIDSFEIDGTPKRIIVVANTGGTNSPFQLTSEKLAFLNEEDHVYLYQVVEYDDEVQSAKLVIRKGNVGKYAKLEGRIFDVTVK